MNTYTIEATPEARRLLESYYNEIVDRRRSGELNDVGQYAARWCEQASRIAVVLHAGLHGAAAYQHPLALETAENAVKLAKWFANQQLNLLAKGRRAAAVKLEDEITELLNDRIQGKRLESKERELGRHIDYVTARNVHRARITPTADAAMAVLTHMEVNGLLDGEDITPAHGGKTTRIFRRASNPAPE